MTHQRVLVYVLSFCFLFFLLPGCDDSGPAEEAGEKIDESVQKQQGQFEEAEKQIAEAKAEIENLRNELTQAHQERDEAKARLEAAEQERQRILGEMERTTINEKNQEETMPEQQQNSSGSQGQGELPTQTENKEIGRQPAEDNTLKRPEEQAMEHTEQGEPMPQEKT